MKIDLTIKDAKELIKLAREAISSVFNKKVLSVNENLKNKYLNKQGVFVTLKTFPEKNLRGCIGFPYPVFPLWEGVINSAIAAAFEDPRFPPLRKEELDNIVIELTILSVPEKIEYSNPEELLKKIVIGRDGLIVRYKSFSGLLLPQVPVEERWDTKTFLSYTCMKAGLPPDFWKTGKAEVFRFEGKIFEEKEPKGEVIEKELVCKECW